MTYDPADNAAKCYALAIEECRKKLESFHRFIGIEIDETYFNTACKRIRDAYAQPDMFIEQDKQPKPEQLSLIGAAE